MGLDADDHNERQCECHLLLPVPSLAHRLGLFGTRSFKMRRLAMGSEWADSDSDAHCHEPLMQADLPRYLRRRTNVPLPSRQSVNEFLTAWAPRAPALA